MPQTDTTKTTKTKASHAYHLLKGLLRNGEFAHGERLTEAKVARKLELGRGPARESLLRLEAEGLLRGNGPYGGKFVQYIEYQEAEKVIERYELREIIEGHAARLAAKNMNAYQVTELERLAEELIKTSHDLGDGDRKRRREVGLAFHHYLVANCGNKLLLKIYEMHQLAPVGPQSQDAAEEAIRNVGGVSTAEHLNGLCRAIRSRKGDEAEACIRRRIRAVTEQMRAAPWAHKDE